MATMTQPTPTRTKTTIFKETLPPDDRAPSDAQPAPFYARDWEIVMAELTPEQWQGHIARVYRADEKWDRSSSPIDNTFSAPFGEEDLRQRFGGGRYVIWLLGPPKKHNLVGKYHVTLDGQPIVNGTPRQAPGTDGNSVAMQALQMMNSPEIMRMQFDMMRNAAMSVIELMKSQMPQAQDPLQTLRNAKEILGVGNGGGEHGLLDTIRTLKELGLIGSPEKKGVEEILALITTLKTSGLISSGAPKADLAATFANNLPMLVDRLVGGLHEFRLNSEAQERTVRLQRGEIRASDPNVIDVAPSPAQSAAPATNGAARASSYSGAASPAASAVSPAVAQGMIVQSHLHRL